MARSLVEVPFSRKLCLLCQLIALFRDTQQFALIIGGSLQFLGPRRLLAG